jgi:hypothetical protein
MKKGAKKAKKPAVKPLKHLEEACMRLVRAKTAFWMEEMMGSVMNDGELNQMVRIVGQVDRAAERAWRFRDRMRAKYLAKKKG